MHGIPVAEVRPVQAGRRYEFARLWLWFESALVNLEHTCDESRELLSVIRRERDARASSARPPLER